MIAWAVLIALLSAGSPATSPVTVWGGSNGSTPVAVSGLSSAVTDVQAANWGGLAIENGNVYQWTNSDTPAATKVSGPQSIVSIGEGGGDQYGAAITSSGQMWTWGYDGDGQLCNGKTGSDFSPSLVDVSNATEVSGGQEHLEYLTGNGYVKGCGNNEYGQLGNGTMTNSSTQVKAEGLTDVTQISAGNQFTLALDSSGRVWAWGENDLGQLGDGTTTNSDVPVQVQIPDPSPAVQIYAGGSQRNPPKPNGSGIARLADGNVYAWGDDAWDQLGVGGSSTTCTVLGTDPPEQVACSDTPVQVEGLPSDVTYVAMGGADSFALTSSGDLYGWGDNSAGQMGNGGDSPSVYVTPTLLESGVAQISAVANTVVALNTQG